jgi:LPS sulfotransferase NodH
MRFRKRRPVEFLEWLFLRGYDQTIRAVGFKVFYFQLEKPYFDQARTYLASLPGLRVLHLRRRNLLRAYLSKVVMVRTKVSGIKSDAERRAPSVALAPADCLRYFEHTRQQQNLYERLFAEQAVLPVLYEDLAADYDRETERIQKFLDVVPTSLQARNLRQEIRPLSVAISNYAELRTKFESTPWAEFFDD